MIFIGPNLSEPNAHFVTNIVDCIGSAGQDLVLDLRRNKDSNSIFKAIREHCIIKYEKLVIYNACEDEEFFISFKNQFPELTLFTFFSDDEWRHLNYDRYIALYSDFFSIAVKGNIDKYLHYGMSNVIYVQWACNPKSFYPLPHRVKLYDVTFIGAPYGKRTEYIRYLVEKGVSVKVFGNGWKKEKDLKSCWGGYLTNRGMLEVISTSKINLNFLWTSRQPDITTIKGRSLELAACKAFQLSNYTTEFENYGFFDGTNIATFGSKEEMLEKVKYYLKNEHERTRIADSSYDYVLKEHTWEKRFGYIFRILQKGKKENYVSIPKILVVLLRDITHNIESIEQRVQIEVIPLSKAEKVQFEKYNGIIFLERESTMNSNAILMMAFALVQDNSSFVISNFYLSGKGKQPDIWIRFREEMITKAPKRLNLLPLEAIMMSSASASQFVKTRKRFFNGKFSIVEYPCFTITKLKPLRKIVLRMFFGEYNKKKEFKSKLTSWKFLEAANILVDHLFQKRIMV
jgi:hypothetical protein